MAPKKSSTTRKPSELIKCPNCGKEVSARGLSSHARSRACRDARAPVNRDEADAFDQLLDDYDPAPLESGPSQPQAVPAPAIPEFVTFEGNDWEADLNEFPPIDHNMSSDLEPDDIKIEYHPSSGKAPKISHFEDYTTSLPANSDPPVDSKPWRPFRTRFDFDLGAFVSDAHLNESEIDSLFLLFKRCIEDPASFTLSGNDELKEIWRHARETKATGFETKIIQVAYKDEDLSFPITFRPIWETCLDFLRNPALLSQFKWNAERHYKYNGPEDKWERFIDEPWTADAWWKIQDKLPAGALPLCLCVYADKTRLSSFGTAKGYPVMMRCANLPIHLRNGEGIGGGRVVGFLPIVEEDAGESGKKGYVNFKRVVWHKSFYEIIKSLEDYAETGYTMPCVDGIIRWLFPIILILSADYEEQCVMALIRGINSAYPCPVCLVPNENLDNLSEEYDLRSTVNMQDVYADAERMNLTEGDKLLKSYGLRQVENVFWKMKGSDVYDALSWDRLHAFHGGLFSDHLWVQFKDIIDNLPGRVGAIQIDNYAKAIPPWSGLNHFNGIMKAGEYTDGRKYEDMSKIIVFAAHQVLTPDVSERGFSLLQMIRGYLELDMYASLTVHTERTLEKGEHELLKFEKLKNAYQEVYDLKSWLFPKFHSPVHLFPGIRNQGVTANYNTKPYEKAHRLLKHAYQNQTNFKNVIPQLSKINETDLCKLIIRSEIELFDQSINDQDQDASDAQFEAKIRTPIGSAHISLGSRSPPITFAAIETEKRDDPAFKIFRSKLSKTLATHLNQSGIKFTPDACIAPYKLLKVNYESTISWRQETDILRVNPNFHNRPRYDYVIIEVDKTRHTCIFAQLLEVFGIEINGSLQYMALIIPMDERLNGSSRAIDKALRFTRVRSRPRSKSVFINIESIIRGGLLVQSFEENVQRDEYLVVDVVDEDMWWRMKSLKLALEVKL